MQNGILAEIFQNCKHFFIYFFVFLYETRLGGDTKPEILYFVESEAISLFTRRTDLALEAHELWQSSAKKKTLAGVRTKRGERFGCEVTRVEISDAEAETALGKPCGAYVTIDVSRYWDHAEDALERTAGVVGAELRTLLGSREVKSALVVGLGNDAMTPDAIGPQACRHVLVTRHLMQTPAFAAFASVGALVPGVLGRTGVEAAELIRGAVRTVQPDVLITIDALASRALARVCTTVQLSDTGIVPGSGVGNRRSALNEQTVGVPVIAVGVPTVVDANTLALDILEEAGADGLDPKALRGHGEDVMVTPRDIDAQIRELARVVGYGIDLALQPLSFADLSALIG